MLLHSGSPELRTERLVLREYAVSDYEMMFTNWASDPEVTKYLTWDAHKDRMTTQALISDWADTYQSPNVYHWGITMRGELIGDISVVKWNGEHEWCELGYCLCRRFWSQGIMTEALLAVKQYLFETVGFHRIQLKHDIMNIGSGRVMQKAGFTYEGTMKETHLRKDKTWADICLYGLTRDTLQQRT